MKIKLDNYTFNPVAKTVTFTDYASLDLSDVILITNVTDGTIIFNFASPNLVGSVVANVLTLNYDTTAMSSTDKLAIYLDDSNTPSTDESVVLLRRLIQLLTPIATQDSRQRQRVVVEGIEGSAVIGNVGSVSSINAYASVDARFPIIDQARNTFANAIRQNLTY